MVLFKQEMYLLEDRGYTVEKWGKGWGTREPLILDLYQAFSRSSYYKTMEFIEFLRKALPQKD